MFFYKSPHLLEEGAAIGCGNWGRKILGVGPGHTAFYRECLFETIREREFPHRPSRMTAAFAFPDEALAASWKRGNLPELLYAVRPASDDAEPCRLDMGWFDELTLQHSFKGAETIVRRYWSGDMRERPQIEAMFTCALVVTRRITRIPEDAQHP